MQINKVVSKRNHDQEDRFKRSFSVALQLCIQGCGQFDDCGRLKRAPWSVQTQGHRKILRNHRKLPTHFRQFEAHGNRTASILLDGKHKTTFALLKMLTNLGKVDHSFDDRVTPYSYAPAYGSYGYLGLVISSVLVSLGASSYGPTRIHLYGACVGMQPPFKSPVVPQSYILPSVTLEETWS